LKLDPLPDLAVTRPPRTGQRRRPRGLIIDERTEMTTVSIKKYPNLFKKANFHF
jgi:hypothetical protein